MAAVYCGGGASITPAWPAPEYEDALVFFCADWFDELLSVRFAELTED
jgi:hypothetical protein